MIPRFSIRELSLAIIAVAVLLGWWMDHKFLSHELLASRLSAVEFRVRLNSMQEIQATGPEDEIVPALIHSVGDPDVRIAFGADELLRKRSGITQGFGSIEDPSPKVRLSIVRSWIDWYLSKETSPAR